MALLKSTFITAAAFLAVFSIASGSPVDDGKETEIQTVTKIWNDQKSGKSVEYLIRFQRTGFLDAFAFCRNINAQLLSVDSEEELQFLRASLSEFTDFYGFWTSGVDVLSRSSAGQQIWATNGQAILPSLFAPGEPNGSFENCINLHNTVNGYFLNDISCNVNNMFVICEYETAHLKN